MTTSDEQPPISPSATAAHTASPAPAPKRPLPFGPSVVRAKPPHRHHRLRWTLLGIGGVVVVILAVTGWVLYRAVASINTQKDGSNKKIGVIQQLAHLVTASSSELRGESDDRVNILLMGYGGPGHDGPYLTDTMMVISVKPSTHQVAMLSIPRDLVINIPNRGYQKINGALTYGKWDNYPGGGEVFATKMVSDLLNLPIQYYARADFSGFEQIIDKLGGITVHVDNAFSDYSYPTENYGYQTIRFKVGDQVMDGATALKFARSRHGNNGEGTDFARAKRQQKILEGIRTKTLSLGTILNPIKMSDILKTLGTHTQTNMEVWEMIRLANLVKETPSNEFINRVFDDRPNNLLRAATGTGGAYILLPRSGNYEDMRFFAKSIFQVAAANAENAPVAVLNASKQTGLGTSFTQSLTGFAVPVLKTATSSRPYGKTVIIDATGGSAPATAALLAAYARTSHIISPMTWVESGGDQAILKYFEPPVKTTNAVVPKFIVVLGTDQPAPTKSIFTGATKSTNTNAATNKNANKNTNTAKSTNKNKNVNTNKSVSTNTNTATNANTNTAPDTNTSTNTNS